MPSFLAAPRFDSTELSARAAMVHGVALTAALRRRRAALALLVASLTGCSTQTTSFDDVDLFFRFRANDTLVELTTSADVYGVFVANPCTGEDTLQVAAWNLSIRLGLNVSSIQNQVGLGTYSTAQSVDDPTLRISLYYQAPDGIDYIAEPVTPDDVTIVISHIGGATIDGTFFGVAKAAGQPDVMITDGAFTVRREQDMEASC
jgi:hypothetical protein